MIGIGKDMDRIDGPEKVSGNARYAAEFSYGNLHYGVIVPATVAAGEIIEIDTREAIADRNVLAILDYRNAPRMESVPVFPLGPSGESVMPLQDARVLYAGQAVALAVAKTPEAARDAAGSVRVRYREVQPRVMSTLLAAGTLWTEPPDALWQTTDVTRGNVQSGLARADFLVDAVFDTPGHSHNALELGAAMAHWDGERLLLHDSSQWVLGTRNTVSRALGIPLDRVRVLSPYVGGGFGSKCFTWAHTLLAAAAARYFGVPVQIVLTRAQTHLAFGSRPAAHQRITIGARADGKLVGIRHHAVAQTSTHDVFLRAAGEVSEVLYACPNLETRHWLLPVNSSTPTNMRAPAESYGSFALESAMDEMAVRLKLDPLELRRRNLPATHPDGMRWSSCALGRCYEEGAQAFGWDKRPLAAQTMREGGELIGWGMAAGTYGCYRSQAAVAATLRADGAVELRCATQEIGTGTRTLMAQIAAATLGLSAERIAVYLGDTDLPTAPVHGASRTAGSVAPAVLLAAQALLERLIVLAISQIESPLAGCPADAIEVWNGSLQLREEPGRTDPFSAILRRAGLLELRVERRAGPPELGEEDWKKLASGVNSIRMPKTERLAMYGFVAHFVEVRVRPEFGSLRITRAVMRAAAGRILNPKQARSQLLGSLVFGVGMALREEVKIDPRNGRVVSASPTDYHLPAFADIPQTDLDFVNEEDTDVNELGAKGVGELGLVGFAAAVANAVWHATGERFRSLPITPAKLITTLGENR